jgi:hypothetical protein
LEVPLDDTERTLALSHDDVHLIWVGASTDLLDIRPLLRWVDSKREVAKLHGNLPLSRLEQVKIEEA